MNLTWERITPLNIHERLDDLRQVVGACANGMSQSLVVQEVYEVQNPSHICALLWQDGICRGWISGGLWTVADGSLEFRASWINYVANAWMPEDKAEPIFDPLDDYMKSLGVSVVLLTSKEEPQMIATPDRQFVEVARIYRREVR